MIVLSEPNHSVVNIVVNFFEIAMASSQSKFLNKCLLMPLLQIISKNSDHESPVNGSHRGPRFLYAEVLLLSSA